MREGTTHARDYTHKHTHAHAHAQARARRGADVNARARTQIYDALDAAPPPSVSNCNY